MQPMQLTIYSEFRSDFQTLISDAGYKTLGDFSHAAQVDEETARLVISGRLIPSREFIANAAAACRTTRKKVVEALY